MAEILLVEDTRDLADQIADIFRMEGHRVHVTHNGSEALGLLLNKTIIPDVIVTDLIMPGLDGFGLVEQLKNLADFKNIPIVIMSAKCDKDTLDRTASLGVERFLAKPCAPEKLVDSIHLVLKS